MATAMYPGEYPDRPLHSFINHPELSAYARQAEALLTQLPQVFVPRVQYKRPGVKNTCWYVALREEPDVWLVNFTLVPSDLNIELRLARYFTVEPYHQSELGLWYQNNWPTFGLRRIGAANAKNILTEYIDNARADVLAGQHKSPSRSSAEYFLRQDLKALFPEARVRHGERPIRHDNGAFLELDLQVRDYKLAIEIQGPTHYAETNYFGNFAEVNSRDEFKKAWCRQQGIKLIHLEWEGYMKTLYRLPETTRRAKLRQLLDGVLQSGESFFDIREADLRKLL